jgi:hypothetical protein
MPDNRSTCSDQPAELSPEEIGDFLAVLAIDETLDAYPSTSQQRLGMKPTEDEFDTMQTIAERAGLPLATEDRAAKVIAQIRAQIPDIDVAAIGTLFVWIRRMREAGAWLMPIAGCDLNN